VHRDQRGVTLVELLVACTIIGLALALMTGSFSSAVIGARIARNTTGAELITQNELDRVRAIPYTAAAAPYSWCYATEGVLAPPPSPAPTYLGACRPSDLYRADVTVSAGPLPNMQKWTVSVKTWPQPAQIVPPVDVLKDNR
jgi:prepilin-type N-terminal cleavage/methylation domain-containing protein